VLADWLRRRGFDARSTTANWVLVKVPDPAAFVHALEARRVYIRDRSNFPQLAGWVRMSVGTAEQTGQLCDRLDDAFKELGIGRG
jgi:histidinol-phosphate/aromatic aminotransferase/cobyric acid decarboxylase-like protein